MPGGAPESPCADCQAMGAPPFPLTPCVDLSVILAPVNYFYGVAKGKVSNSTFLSTRAVFLYGPPSPTCIYAHVPALTVDALLNALRPIATVRQGWPFPPEPPSPLPLSPLQAPYVRRDFVNRDLFGVAVCPLPLQRLARGLAHSRAHAVGGWVP